MLPHPSYLPDLAPSGYNLFRSLQNALRGKIVTIDEDIKSFLERKKGKNIFECVIINDNFLKDSQKQLNKVNILLNKVFVSHEMFAFHLQNQINAIAFGRSNII